MSKSKWRVIAPLVLSPDDVVHDQTLEEAITASRTAGDNKTLQHCSRYACRP